MTYLTTKDIVNLTGLGVEVVDENLGVGDDKRDSFDLEFDNCIASSYTISYAEKESNDFTELVDVTDYSLDLDSGRILLTTAGKTATEGKVIYAKYIYSPKVSNTILSTYVVSAEAEVGRITGANWGPAKTAIEYFDGKLWYAYPRTDQPFARDYDKPNYVKVSNKNVLSIDYVASLSRGAIFADVQVDDGGSFSDVTDDANEFFASAFYVLNSVPAVNDAIYFGVEKQYFGMKSTMKTLGTGSPTITWEYYDGSTWTSFTPTDDTAGASSFAAEGSFTWDTLDSWAKTTVNGSGSYYFIRARLSAGSYTIPPEAYTFTIDQDTVIDQYLNPAYVDFRASGRIALTNFSIPNGTRNIKVKYQHGVTETPDEVAEFTALYAGLRAYAYVTGGSYDDETRFSIGRKDVSIGEVYVNVREVVKQFRERITELKRVIGGKHFFA